MLENDLISIYRLEIFDATSGEEYDNIFLQHQWKFEVYLGAKWRELTPITIIRKFIGFLI
jgi:hypothetical protein